jgi:molybdate transport system substrate-binding protein
MGMKKWMKNFCTLFVMTAILIPAFGQKAAAAEKVVVFAAASTTNALSDIGRLFTEKHLGTFIPSFASSSTLAKQIENGAPADIYVSANLKWMDYLVQKKAVDTASRIDLLGNNLVLIAPKNSSLKKVDIKAGFDLAGLLHDGMLAMGDPSNVPAGIYGKQALERLGVWASISKKIASAKDVRAALVLVERAETPLGIVYATDAAISHKVKVVGIFPENSHPPIVYPVAIVAGARRPVVTRFLKFLQSPEAKAIFVKYGFSVR